MSSVRSIFARAAGFCILAAACWLVTGAVPLTAQVTDGPGVTVDLGGAPLMHRTAVAYPAAALAQHIEGAVTVEATLDANGNVTDAHVISGTDELRKTALLAVLQWHFGRAGAGATKVVTIRFQTPSPVAQAAPPTLSSSLVAGVISPSGAFSGSINQMVAGGQLAPAQRTAEPQRIAAITVSGLFDPFKDELLASLPVHEGDLFVPQNLATLITAVRQYDEHLSVSTTQRASSGLELRITAPGATMSLAGGTMAAIGGSAAPANALAVAGAVQEANLLRKVMPVYPPLARETRIQDHVVLNAIIGKDGTVQELKVVSGHPMLAPAAMDAVRQWTYRPTLLNGQPVDVSTQIDVNFTLGDQPPPQ